MSIPILEPGTQQLNSRLAKEPKHRLSQSQRESLLQVGLEDPRAHVLGLDDLYRPVVKTRMPAPSRSVRYAVSKAGSAVKEKQPMAERW